MDLDSITLDLCRRHVDEIVLLTETEIEASVRLLFEQHRLIVEGSGALAVGGLLKRKEQFKGKKVVAVVCGRNIDLEVFKRTSLGCREAVDDEAVVHESIPKT